MKRRLLPLLLTVVLVVALAVPMFAITAAAEEAIITFDNTDKRTEFSTTKQVWKENGITVTNNKGSSNSNVGNYSKPVRFYANSELVIECSSGNITKIVVNCNTTGYATDLKNSVGREATVSGKAVTITPTGTASSYTIAQLTKQVKVDSLTVTYEAAGGSEQPDSPVCTHEIKVRNEERDEDATCTKAGNIGYDCAGCGEKLDETVPATNHPNQTTSTVDATCTEKGSVTVICDDCHDTLSTEEIGKLPHEYGNDDVCDECGYVKPAGFVLVTDASALKVGDKIIIVAKDYDFALGTTQNGNNRSQAAITKDGDVVSIDDNVQIITLEAGTVDGTFAFYVEGEKTGYLYAAGGTGNNNYLRTQATNTESGSWKIEINANGVATIKAQGAVVRNWLRYNKDNPLFACYGSGQQDIAIYKLPAKEPEITEPKFDAVSMLVSNDLALNYLVKVPTDFTGKLTVKFTVGAVDGKVIWGELQTERNNGRYVFSLYGIAPQDIAKNIKAELFVDDVKLEGADKDYSVLTYIKNTKEKYASDTKLVALLDSVLVYGQVAKDYIGADGDAIADAGLVDEALNAATKPDANFNPEANRPVGADPYYNCIAGVALRFDYQNSLCVRVRANGAFTLTLGEGEGAILLDTTLTGKDGKYGNCDNYIAYITVAIKDFDTKYTLNMYDANGVLTHTMTYSVNTYLAAMWDDAATANLAKATYLLGKAAFDYAAVEDQLN